LPKYKGKIIKKAGNDKSVEQKTDKKAEEDYSRTGHPENLGEYSGEVED
jgi:hypothetical protein